MKPLPPPWDRFVPFLRRMSIWAAFFILLWFLRQFFLLVFLTFVFGYVQAHAVDAFEKRIPKRPLRVTVVLLALLGALVGFGYVMGPALYEQAQAVPKQITKAASDIDEYIQKKRAASEFWRTIIPEDTTTKTLVGQFFGALNQPQPTEDNTTSSPIPLVLNVVRNGLATAFSFLLSLLFSFLIVLDLPNIARGLRRLRESRARVVYEELSDTIFEFGRVLGRALEAQLMIATINTTLTFIGLKVMGLEYVVFLSAVVFVCSFIPVAGVFISSVPIGLVALANGGFTTLLWSIGFITFIHLIEAYVLNPRIYGAHLRMNPVLTLAILFVCEHLFGVWGLILGVPVTSYLVRHVIMDVRGEARAREESAVVP